MDSLPTYSDAATAVGNPFPGLRSFDVWENHLFFGRDEQVGTLLRKLAQHRFVCVVGTSGSGKSSLVRAGLLPELYGGFLAAAGSFWRVAVMRPGSDPLHNLAAALSAEDVFGGADADDRVMRTAMTEAALESSSLGLAQVVRQAGLADHENLLLVVDQFEELFRFKENARIEGAADHAAAFVKLLLAAIAQRELPVYVVLTVRSDFLGDCAQYRDLPEMINDGQYLIPRLQREQQRLAIVGPVAVGAGKIAPRLVQQLLNDVGDNPDQLPILQHALMRTWEAWVEDHDEGEPIELRHYDAIGGMRSALSQHADEAYHELPDERSRAIAAALFKTLTEVGQDNRGIRRPTTLRTVCAVADASVEVVAAVVDVFRRPGRSFITPPDGVTIGPETVLDISHESLMRVWQRLGRWVSDDAESARIYRRLVESATLFEEGQAGLWRDPELQVAVEWREREHPNEAWALLYDRGHAKAMAFLDASVRERDHMHAEKRRLRRLTRAVVIVFLASAGVLTAWALSERSSATTSAITAMRARSVAEQQTSRAITQERTARVRKTQAEQSNQLAQQQRLRAEAERRAADEQRREAERQRQLAVAQKGEALTQRQRAEQFGQQAVAARDIADAERRRALEQRTFAEQARQDAESSERNATRLRLLSIGRALSIKSMQMQTLRRDALSGLLALQGYRFARASGDQPHDPDAYSALVAALKSVQPDALPAMRAHAGGVRSVSYSADGRHLVSAGGDGRLLLWDAATAREPRELVRLRGAIRSASFDPGGRQIAFGGDDGVIRTIGVPGASVAAVSFATGRAAIVTVAYGDGGIAWLAADGAAGLWRPDDERSVPLALDAPLSSIAVSSDGNVVAGGTSDGRIALWDLQHRGAPRMLSGGAGVVSSLALSADGSRVAAGSADGTIHVWRLTTSEAAPALLHGHASPVHGLAFNRDASLLASAGADATIRIWSVVRPDDRPIVIHEHAGWVWSVAFSPDGATVASGGYDRTLRLWPTDPERLAGSLELQLGRNLTRTEWQQFVGSDIPYRKTIARLGD
jgi:energy-coupling factor transporter ATP-binding protein EcfA2